MNSAAGISTGPVKVLLRRRRPVHVELPLEQPRGAGLERHEVVRGARRRGRRPVEVRGQNAAFLVRVEDDHARRRAREHRAAVEGVRPAAERVVRPEHVEGHVVRVGPDTELAVVAEEVVARLELVLVVVAGRIARRRHRDALVEGTGGIVRQRELREDPAVGLAVVADERIAVVLDLARAAEPGPERVSGERTQHDVAGLVVDHGDVVDVLDVVIGADVAFRVGRHDQPSGHRAVVVVRSALELDRRLGLREAEMLLRRGIRDRSCRARALLRHRPRCGPRGWASARPVRRAGSRAEAPTFRGASRSPRSASSRPGLAGDTGAPASRTPAPTETKRDTRAATFRYIEILQLGMKKRLVENAAAILSSDPSVNRPHEAEIASGPAQRLACTARFVCS